MKTHQTSWVWHCPHARSGSTRSAQFILCAHTYDHNAGFRVRILTYSSGITTTRYGWVSCHKRAMVASHARTHTAEEMGSSMSNRVTSYHKCLSLKVVSRTQTAWFALAFRPAAQHRVIYRFWTVFGNVTSLFLNTNNTTRRWIISYY